MWLSPAPVLPLSAARTFRDEQRGYCPEAFYTYRQAFVLLRPKVRLLSISPRLILFPA